MHIKYSIDRIFDILGNDCIVVGEYEGEITGIASLSEGGSGDLSFLGNAKYRSYLASSKSSVILVPLEYEKLPKIGQIYIKVENPSYALALICRDIEYSLIPKPEAGIHPSAIIEPDAKVSSEASVGAFCYVASGAQVGASILESHVSIGRSALVADEVHLFPRVSVGDYCEIGPRNRLMSGSVIGSDGYGYEFVKNTHQRVPQLGNVVTDADVDIGANTCIDRARFGSTHIGLGTKIDNQVQIAHNVTIGRHCLIVAQVGISGSVVLGDRVVIGGQSGIAGHLSIGTGAMIAAGTSVFADIEPQSRARGYPAMPMMQFNRIAVLQRKLPEFFKRFDQLEKMVNSTLK